MSILSQLFTGKITFSQAVSQGEQWFESILTKADPSAQADVAQGLSDFKQAASNAVALADTALGPILATGTAAVETAASAALTSIVGPIASATLTPGLDAALTQGADALKAEVDAQAAQIRAQLSTGTATTAAAQPAAA